MFIRKKENVCIVEGIDAIGIYDFNKQRLYRVDLRNNLFFKIFENNNAINEEDLTIEQKKILKTCLELEIVEKSKNDFSDKSTEKDKIDFFIDDTIKPEFAWLEITSYCNQCCMHCFMAEELNQKELSIEVILEIVRSLADMGVKNIALTGGEPTLHNDIEKIITYIHSFHIGVVLLTNGINIKQELIHIIKECNVNVKIPLFGKKETHEKITMTKGSYDSVKKNIERLIEEGVYPTLTTTVTNINYEEMDDIQALADALDLDFEKSPVFPIGNAKKNRKILIPEEYQSIITNCETFNFNNDFIKSDGKYITIPKKINKYLDCGTRNIVILSSGKVAPCLLLRDEQFIIGSVYENDFKNLLSNSNHEFLKLQQNLCYERIVPCNRCEVKYLCKGGGCKAVSYLFHGILDKKINTMIIAIISKLH